MNEPLWTRRLYEGPESPPEPSRSALDGGRMLRNFVRQERRSEASRARRALIAVK